MDPPAHEIVDAAGTAAFAFEDEDERTWSPQMLVRIVTSDVEDFSAANERGLDADDLDDDMRIFYSFGTQPFSLEFYVQRLVTYCNCSTSCFVVALVYLDTVQIKCRELSLTRQNCHRLLCTALLLAIKVLDDEVCKQDFYASVFGLPNEELNTLELAMLELLDWNLFVDVAVYKRYEEPLYAAATYFCGSDSPDDER